MLYLSNVEAGSEAAHGMLAGCAEIFGCFRTADGEFDHALRPTPIPHLGGVFRYMVPVPIMQITVF